MFALDDSFLAKFRNRQPKWGPLGYVTFARTYARPVPAENRIEEFWETLQRVVEGTYSLQQAHCARHHLPWDAAKAQRSAQEMYQRAWDFKWLPPGRGLKMMGTEFVTRKGGAALNNCAFVTTANIDRDFSEPFTFLQDMSMLGVGVGSDTRGAGKVIIEEPAFTEGTWVVPDTREGWVDATRRTLNAYIGIACPGEFDYSKIRPYGSDIGGLGGTASGPEPLIQLQKDIRSILDACVGKPISSAAIVDIHNAIGRCVVSGNIRRTAEIMFGAPDDDEFLTLKDPDQHQDKLNAWRWASNNSVFAKEGQDFSKVAELIAKNGEPGIFWLDLARQYGRMSDPPDNKDFRVLGSNPCCEQSLEDKELCCLVETFPAHHTDLKDYLRTLKFAYLYSKTVTLVPTHSLVTNAVTLRNRRIGTSMSGIAQAIEKFGMPEFIKFCRNGYEEIQLVDESYSNWLCVPRSIKTTSVKPSGTVSLLCGATPGIHFPYAEYYWRTIRFDASSPLVAQLRNAGYRTVEGEGSNTVIVYFPVREQNFRRSRDQVTMWEQLELAAQLQAHWADNQVSVTVTFKPEEAKDILPALDLYSRRLKSVSFLPLVEHGFAHAPYQKIDRETYEAAVAKLKPVDEVLGMHVNDVGEQYCDSDRCVA